MALSGAAVSPNWGYHSSPITSFIMMMFNVRLGAWLGNPEHEATWLKEGPRSSFRMFVQEALGWTDDRQPWIYLSDGGHFDNLGIYEMIRRRCRTILAVDSTADPNCSFADLGALIHKAFIDFGVSIDFGEINLHKRSESQRSGVYAALATIHYPPENSPPGTLIYIKPSFYGSEPADVRAYAAANADFPHESTLDQWFSETQFESYRALGSHIIEAVCRGALKDGEVPAEGKLAPNVSELVKRARAYVAATTLP
jgi:hypothetical protein